MSEYSNERRDRDSVQMPTRRARVAVASSSAEPTALRWFLLGSAGLAAALLLTAAVGCEDSTASVSDTDATAAVSGYGDAEMKMPEIAGVSPIVATEGTKVVNLKVDGMTCVGCVSSVVASAKGIEGVSDVEVNLQEGQAWILIDEATTTTDEAIAKAISEGSIKATVLTAEAPAEEAKG